VTDRFGAVSLAPLALRAVLVLAGVGVLLGGGYLVTEGIPDALDADDAPPRSYREHVSYWTPEEGHQQALRSTEQSIEASSRGLALVERVEGVHSPRGAAFALPVNETYDVPGEPAVDARFAPTLPWEDPPATVHLAVPWATSEGTRVGAIDTFHRLDVVERDGTTLVKYFAREPSQFFVVDGTIWYRSAERIEYVEPATGSVVDYERTETLWTEDFDPSTVGQLTREYTSEREKVWSATVKPTPTASDRLLEQALEKRESVVEEAAWTAGIAFVVGQTLLGAGLMARPRRWLAP